SEPDWKKIEDKRKKSKTTETNDLAGLTNAVPATAFDFTEGGTTNGLYRLDKQYLISRRRPATFSDILAIFEHQRKSAPKQQFIDDLKSAGEIATGAGIFVTGPSYHKVVNFVTGIVTTELEKRLLWEVILNAKNIESRSFKEIEEVPARSSIHRVVFFPKRPIYGIVANYPVYISSFSSQQAVAVRGSLIEKTDAVESEKLPEESPNP
ncbi:MAG: hypothetical protein JWM68_4478, partial [Verrucomicrobiales bacterium]|nr:hypothetical protein [Verrucomicrobiales bacterium]